MAINEEEKKNNEQRKLLQKNLLKSKEENLSFDINVDEFVREWYDSYHNETSSIRAYIERIIGSVVDIESNVPSFILKYAGTGIDSLNDLLTNFDKFEKVEKLNTTERHVKEKLAKILLDAVTKDLSNLNHVVSILTVTGAIHGTAAGILTPIGGFALAALAWGAVGFSSVGLYRASRLYASPTYQLEDQLARYNKVDKKILDLADDISKLRNKLNDYSETNENDKNKIQAIQQKIASRERKLGRWVMRQEAIKQTAINIIQFNSYNAALSKGKLISNDLKDTFIATVYQSEQASAKKPYQSVMMPTKVFVDSQSQEISDVNKNMMIQLKKNQRDLIISRTISTMSLSIMAVGMTLAAVSPYTAHAAPIVMAVGFALIALGGAVQLGQMLSVKLVNMIAKKVRYKQVEKELINDMNANSAGNLKDVLGKGDNLKYYLSFKLSKEKLQLAAREQLKLGKISKMPTDADLEAEWYKSLNNKSSSDRKRIVNNAKRIVTKEAILNHALGIKPGQPIPSTLTEKDKTKIINRASRNALRHGITDGVSDIYKNTKEKISVESKNGVLQIKRLGLF